MAINKITYMRSNTKKHEILKFMDKVGGSRYKDIRDGLIPYSDTMYLDSTLKRFCLTGLLYKVERGYYVITDKGRRTLKTLNVNGSWREIV